MCYGCIQIAIQYNLGYKISHPNIPVMRCIFLSMISKETTCRCQVSRLHTTLPQPLYWYLSPSNRTSPQCRPPSEEVKTPSFKALGVTRPRFGIREVLFTTYRNFVHGMWYTSTIRDNGFGLFQCYIEQIRFIIAFYTIITCVPSVMYV